MPRPRLHRNIRYQPNVTYFKPQGVPMSTLEIVEITMEEAEALRLKNVDGLDQNQSARSMMTSQSTFQRILASVYNKIGDAIINGKAIRIVRDN